MTYDVEQLHISMLIKCSIMKIKKQFVNVKHVLKPVMYACAGIVEPKVLVLKMSLSLLDT